MTVNERLFSCGVIDKWDDAVKQRNRDAMLAILSGVAMNPKEAIYTTDTILKNPAYHGF